MKRMYRYTPSSFGLRTRGSSESAILIFEWVLACDGSGVNKVTDEFGADVNSELTRKKRDIFVKKVLTLCSSFGILHPLTTQLCHPRSKSACRPWYVKVEPE